MLLLLLLLVSCLFSPALAAFDVHHHTFVTTQRQFDLMQEACDEHVCDMIIYDSTSHFDPDHRPRRNVPLFFVDASKVRTVRDALGGRRSLRIPSFEKPSPPNFVHYDDVRGKLHERPAKILLTGLPNPDMAHAVFAAHAWTEPEILHVVAHQGWPTHEPLRRVLGHHPWIHDHVVVFMNGTELVWRKCARHPLLKDLGPCSFHPRQDSEQEA